MTLKFILLDGAQGLIIIPVFFLIHLISTLLIEGSVLYFFKYKMFLQCLYDAFIANLSSLIIGLLLYFQFQKLSEYLVQNRSDNRLLILLLIYYFQTVIVEGVLLKYLNKTFPTRKLIVANILMNLLTYATLYLILKTIR